MKKLILSILMVLTLSGFANAELLMVSDDSVFKSVIQTNSIDKSVYPLVSVTMYFSYKKTTESINFLNEVYGKVDVKKIDTTSTEVYINCEQNKWMMGEMRLYDKKQKLFKTIEAFGSPEDIKEDSSFEDLATFLCN